MTTSKSSEIATRQLGDNFIRLEQPFMRYKFTLWQGHWIDRRYWYHKLELLAIRNAGNHQFSIKINCKIHQTPLFKEGQFWKRRDRRHDRCSQLDGPTSQLSEGFRPCSRDFWVWNQILPISLRLRSHYGLTNYTKIFAITDSRLG